MLFDKYDSDDIIGSFDMDRDGRFSAAALRTASEVTVTVWDPSYFVDFTLSRDPPDATRPTGILVEASTADDHADRYEFPPDLYVSQAPPAFLKMAVVRFRIAPS